MQRCGKYDKVFVMEYPCPGWVTERLSSVTPTGAFVFFGNRSHWRASVPASMSGILLRCSRGRSRASENGYHFALVPTASTVGY